MSRKTYPFPGFINEDVVSRDRTMKRDKFHSARKPKDDSSSTRSGLEKEKISTLYTKKPKTARARSTSSGQQTTRRLHAEPSVDSVKVKGTTVSKKESWSQMLKHPKQQQSTFNKFDPLRTLHFLIKELECRIKNDIPGKCTKVIRNTVNCCFERSAFAADCARYVVCP